MNPINTGPTLAILTEVAEERLRQDDKWGASDDHPDGTGSVLYRSRCSQYREHCDQALREGDATHVDVFLEEVYEVLSCPPNSPELRTELIQLAAYCAKWVQRMDARRTGDV